MEEILCRLESWFKNVNKVAIAFSGGVDSSLVAFISRHYLGRENTIAVISNSASLKSRDLEIARKFCSMYDIRLDETDAKEMEDPNYLINPSNRCYFCKTALYTMMENLIADLYPRYIIVNGTNLSDQGDYRPGLEAAKEHRIRSPLLECRIGKPDVRALAKHFQLFTWDKPASPCLSSRFPYGETITLKKLRMVEGAENILNDYGFSDIRVRHIGGHAKIEVPVGMLNHLKEIYEEIEPQILKLGFEKCYIDEEGLVSGKLNRDILNVR